jgi:hypothetical protein
MSEENEAVCQTCMEPDRDGAALRALIQDMRDRAWHDHNFTQRAKDLTLAWADELEALLAGGERRAP